MISLFDLREKMRAGWLRWARLVAWWHLRQQLHPFLFRRLAPAKVRLALFGSAQWRREAVQTGLPANKARTIYFGIPLPEPQPRPPETRHRILAVGRLSPEKGVHHLLRALPLIRQSIGDVTLTIIAGPGPTGYRQVLLDLIKDSNLEAIVTILPGVERAALQAAYATHDVLYFYSIFAEPVALVLMEAFAAGLPVVASQSRANAGLIQDALTCLCYDPRDPQSLARAMVAMLADPALGHSLAANALRLVRQEYSLEKMGQAYDEVLREFISALTAIAPLPACSYNQPHASGSPD
jgi:glycosyltransferase involved in cell wall biosynthesis